MARLKLTYGPSTSGAPVAAAPEAVLSEDKYPTELVAKFVPKHFETRLVAELFQLNELEAAFFKWIQPGNPTSTPECYFTAFDPRSQRVVHLMEDLGPWMGPDKEIPKQAIGCNLERTIEVFTEIAKWHSHYYGGYDLPGKMGVKVVQPAANESSHKVFPSLVPKW
jgi:hypothetical protein